MFGYDAGDLLYISCLFCWRRYNEHIVLFPFSARQTSSATMEMVVLIVSFCVIFFSFLRLLSFSCSFSLVGLLHKIHFLLLSYSWCFHAWLPVKNTGRLNLVHQELDFFMSPLKFYCIMLLKNYVFRIHPVLSLSPLPLFHGSFCSYFFFVLSYLFSIFLLQ